MKRRAASAFLVIALLAPAAWASWSAEGNLEPSTPEDALGGFMFVDPDLSAGNTRQVYFNAIPVVPIQASVNPNIGSPHVGPQTVGGGLNLNAMGSRIAPPGGITFIAYLGVWKDCNSDGVVGAADTALHEYRAELLPTGGPCPPGSAYNREGWVSEMLWIHPPRNTPFQPLGYLTDNVVDVWGDIGLPGAAVFADCAGYPFPPGTLATTGGLLSYADCRTNHEGARVISGADQDGSLGLRFADPARPGDDCGHALNREVPLFGEDGPCASDDTGALEEGTGTRAVTAWDCSRPDSVLVHDPTGAPGERGAIRNVSFRSTDEDSPFNFSFGPDGEGNFVRWPELSPAVDPNGSAYDAVNDSERALIWSCVDKPTFASAVLPHDASKFEDPAAGANSVAGKRRADFPLVWENVSSRRSYTLAYPDSGGAAPAARVLGMGWHSRAEYGPTGYKGGTFRDDLQPAGGLWFTFYARLGRDTLSSGATLATQTPGAYGAETCGLATSGILQGWNCDGATWWPTDPMDEALGTARPGTPYHLRDVDCFDGSAGNGAYASLSFLSPDGICPAP